MNLKEIENNQFARRCVDDCSLPKWHDEIEWLITRVKKLTAAIEEIKSWDLYPEERKALEDILNDKNKL